MALRDLIAPSVTIQVPNGDGMEPITVRGLGLDAIVGILRFEGEGLQELYAKAIDGTLDGATVATITTALFLESPDLAAIIIAYGAGEPDALEQARLLPAPVQIEILEEIGRLTFAAHGGPGKTMAIVARVLEGLASLTPGS